MSPELRADPLAALLGDAQAASDDTEEGRLRRALWGAFNTGQAAFTLGWTAFWISAALGVTLAARSPHPALVMARRIWAPGLIHGAGVDLDVRGGDQVDWSRPCLFVCNHQSMIDVPTAFMALDCDVRFIAKRELSLIPFLGWYMRATGMIFVERGEGERARRSIQLASERMREGASVLAFPEGTRSPDGKIHAFKKGAFVVALEAQVPVVPVAIEGAHRVLPRGGFRVRPGPIRVNIGAPIPTAGLGHADRHELSARVHRELVALHVSIGGLGAGLRKRCRRDTFAGLTAGVSALPKESFLAQPQEVHGLFVGPLGGAAGGRVR